MKLKYVGITVVVLAFASPAFANVIFTLGNHPQPNEENILFQITQVGALVTGYTNISNILVDFSSTTDTLSVTAAGQAKITAVDGWINDISIHVPGGGTYMDLILNPFSGGTRAGPAMVTVTTNDQVADFTYDLGAGNNFLTITTMNDEVILSTTVTSEHGFESLLQPRISGPATVPEPVPEPTSLVLIATGLLLLGIRKRATRS